MDIHKLKERKNELHLSYDELAEKSGIPKTTLTNIFLGRTPNRGSHRTRAWDLHKP